MASQIDDATFRWAADGKAALALLSTEMTKDSYYGESRVFLVTIDGKICMEVPLPKAGYGHIFCNFIYTVVIYNCLLMLQTRP